MAVKIGSARIDENKRAKGGAAGDQTGKEVSTQSWYKHVKGWVVYRPVSPDAADKIAWDMQAACDNKNIGYDQSQRNTLYNIAKQFDFDCAAVNKKCETDCSALVRVCCAYAGIMLPNFTTRNEGKVLMETGQFIKLTAKQYTESPDLLCRGDILVTKTQGHTVVVLSNGKNAPDRMDTTEPDTVVINAKSVYVREGPSIAFEAYAYAYRGERYKYLGVTDNYFHKIQFFENVGWVTAKYTSLE